MRTLLCGLAQNAAKRSQGKNRKIIKIVSHYVFFKGSVAKNKRGFRFTAKNKRF